MIRTFTNFHYHKAAGMFLLRLATGLVFLNHGWTKLLGLAGAKSFFAGLGLPAETAILIAVVEVVGGVMLLLGIAPRFAGLILGVEMICAMIMVGLPQGNYELELVLAASALAIFLVGSSRYALYPMERGE